MGKDQTEGGGWTSLQMLSGKAQVRANLPRMDAYLMDLWFGWMSN